MELHDDVVPALRERTLGPGDELRRRHDMLALGADGGIQGRARRERGRVWLGGQGRCRWTGCERFGWHLSLESGVGAGCSSAMDCGFLKQMLLQSYLNGTDELGSAKELWS